MISKGYRDVSSIRLGQSRVASVKRGLSNIFTDGGSPGGPWSDIDDIWGSLSLNGQIHNWQYLYSTDSGWAQGVMSVPIPEGRWYIEGIIDVPFDWSEVGGIGVIDGADAPPEFVGYSGDTGVGVYPNGGTGDWYLPVWHNWERYYAPDVSGMEGGPTIIGIAVDTVLRKVWLRANDGPWIHETGIGNPVTGENPTAVLGGTDELYVAASSQTDSHNVGIIISHVWEAPEGYAVPW